jgi:hypothetical protein
MALQDAAVETQEYALAHLDVLFVKLHEQAKHATRALQRATRLAQSFVAAMQAVDAESRPLAPR